MNSQHLFDILRASQIEATRYPLTSYVLNGAFDLNRAVVDIAKWFEKPTPDARQAIFAELQSERQAVCTKIGEAFAADLNKQAIELKVRVRDIDAALAAIRRMIDGEGPQAADTAQAPAGEAGTDAWLGGQAFPPVPEWANRQESFESARRKIDMSPMWEGYFGGALVRARQTKAGELSIVVRDRKTAKGISYWTDLSAADLHRLATAFEAHARKLDGDDDA